jgi:ketosteroid isomerase-like protein
MSEENVEVVQASFEAWNAGDMDAFRELHHPDAILRMAEGWPEPGPYFGRDAVMREYKQLRDTWKRDTSELIGDFIDVGDRGETWGETGVRIGSVLAMAAADMSLSNGQERAESPN